MHDTHCKKIYTPMCFTLVNLSSVSNVINACDSYILNRFLGNDHLHRLTALGTSELYVRLEKFSGGWFYAKYNEFTVAAETDGYRMRLKVGSYQGNAGI